MRSPKPVEEMNEGHPRAIARRVSDQCKVVRFLRGIAAQQRTAGGAARHHILMITEDRQSLRGQCPRAHVHREWQQFARDLIEIRNHQQQSLRGGKGRRERATEEPAMHCAGHTCFRLHFDDPRYLAPEIWFLECGPFVAGLGHG